MNAVRYGGESTYNGIRRSAGAPGRRDHHLVRAYLMCEAVGSAKGGQTAPAGYSNLELMLEKIADKTTGNSAACGVVWRPAPCGKAN